MRSPTAVWIFGVAFAFAILALACASPPRRIEVVPPLADNGVDPRSPYEVAGLPNVASARRFVRIVRADHGGIRCTRGWKLTPDPAPTVLWDDLYVDRQEAWLANRPPNTVRTVPGPTKGAPPTITDVELNFDDELRRACSPRSDNPPSAVVDVCDRRFDPDHWLLEEWAKMRGNPEMIRLCAQRKRYFGRDTIIRILQHALLGQSDQDRRYGVPAPDVAAMLARIVALDPNSEFASGARVRLLELEQRAASRDVSAGDPMAQLVTELLGAQRPPSVRQVARVRPSDPHSRRVDSHRALPHARRVLHDLSRLETLRSGTIVRVRWAADALFEAGFAAVPALVAALDRDEPWRTAGGGRAERTQRHLG